MRWPSIVLVCVWVWLVGCGGTPERQFCEARERCLAPTTIEVLEQTRAADWCEERLAAAVPDSAGAALDDCARCLEGASCDDIEAGKACRLRCGPVRDAIAQPGSVARAGELAATCTATSLATHASHQSLVRFGELVLEIDCGRSQLDDGVYQAFVLPDEAALAGDQLPCGAMVTHDGAGAVLDRCDAATGTLTVVETGGRRSYAGTCTCNAVALDLDVPYRFFGWALTTEF
ncbi:MAG: hypothetical protein KF773_17255 [Deltaproteobacteria bacterium]|nr:hypothetical protein [Deltaproteobacteria bacterium]